MGRQAYVQTHGMEGTRVIDSKEGRNTSTLEHREKDTRTVVMQLVIQSVIQFVIQLVMQLVIQFFTQLATRVVKQVLPQVVTQVSAGSHPKTCKWS